MKLLIVEQNLEMRRLIIQIVRKASDTIYECADASEAFAAYKVCCPDWVLIDAASENDAGIGAAGKITNAFPGAKVAVVSDCDDAPLREAAAVAGACEFIVKENLLDLRRLFAG